MTTKGLMQVIGIIHTAFPNTYGKQKADDTKMLFALWKDIFEDKDDAIVIAALKNWMSTNTSGFPPTPGMINAEIIKLTEEPGLSAQDAWNLVRHAIKSCDMTDPSPAYNALPDDVKEIVRNSQQILDWACMDTESIETVVASNFTKNYREHVQRKEMMIRIPESVRKIAEQYKEKKINENRQEIQYQISHNPERGDVDNSYLPFD